VISSLTLTYPTQDSSLTYTYTINALDCDQLLLVNCFSYTPIVFGPARNSADFKNPIPWNNISGSATLGCKMPQPALKVKTREIAHDYKSHAKYTLAESWSERTISDTVTRAKQPLRTNTIIEFWHQYAYVITTQRQRIIAITCVHKRTPSIYLQPAHGTVCVFVCLSVCPFVCQHDNSWTVRDIITTFSGHYPILKREAKFENGSIEVRRWWF